VHRQVFEFSWKPILNPGFPLTRLQSFLLVPRSISSSSLTLFSRVSQVNPETRIKMPPAKLQYPEVKRDETVKDNYHGTEVQDPYRWLEDADAELVNEFVEQQNKVTIPFLEQCEVREDIRKRLTELWNYPKYSCPFKRGNRYFYFKNAGLQNQR